MKNRKSLEGLFCTWNSQKIIIHGSYNAVSLGVYQNITIFIHEGWKT